MSQRNIIDSPQEVNNRSLPAKKRRSSKKTRSVKSTSRASKKKSEVGNVVTFPVVDDVVTVSQAQLEQIPVLKHTVVPERQNDINGAIHRSRYAGAIMFGVFLTMFVLVLVTPQYEETEPANIAVAALQVQQNSDSLVRLQNIGERILKEDAWDDSQINQFLQIWASLELSTKRALAATPWYLDFSFALQQRVKLQVQENYNQLSVIENHPVVKLAAMLGIMDLNGIRSSAATTESRYHELVEELKTEIVEADQAFKSSKRKEQSEAALNELLKLKLAADSEAKQPQTITKSSAVPKLIEKPVDTQIGEPVKEQSDSDDKKDTVSAVEIEQLVNEFVQSYEAGNIEQFAALFSPVAKTNDQSGIDGIIKDYSELFDNTSHRLMNIYNLRWQNEDSVTRGIGDMEVAVALREADTVRMLHGKVQISAKIIDGKMLITHLYHIERQ